MAKTCRTCVAVEEVLECVIGWSNAELCENYAEREAPLLVDELGEALQKIWDERFTDGNTAGQYPSGCERPGYTVTLTAEHCDIIQAVLARHKKEVDGA